MPDKTWRGWAALLARAYRAHRLDATLEEQTNAAAVLESEPSRLTAWLAPMDVPLTNSDR